MILLQNYKNHIGLKKVIKQIIELIERKKLTLINKVLMQMDYFNQDNFIKILYINLNLITNNQNKYNKKVLLKRY
jgi:hypothetical protein